MVSEGAGEAYADAESDSYDSLGGGGFRGTDDGGREARRWVQGQGGGDVFQEFLPDSCPPILGLLHLGVVIVKCVIEFCESQLLSEHVLA